jgi:hypothetical protein
MDLKNALNRGLKVGTFVAAAVTPVVAVLVIASWLKSN